MKKLSLFLAVALMIICAYSCKNVKKTQETSLVEEEMPQEVKDHLDSTLTDFVQLKALPIIQKIGEFSLTEEEKMVKPDYLYNPADADKIVSPTQKAYAVYVMSIDRMIAAAYGLPTDEYDAAISKLAVDCNLEGVVAQVKECDETKGQNMESFYNSCIEELGYAQTWTMASVVFIEQLWFLSNNIEKNITLCSDEDVASLTARAQKIQDALTSVALYLPAGDIIINAMTPLYTLSATNVADFKVEIETLKAEVASSRALLFK